MPELPEVETVMRGLMPVMEGKRIKRLVQRRPDLRFPMPDGFEAALKGRVIERMQRRAKYMLFHFDKGPVLLVHLGMSGRMIISPAGVSHPDPAKHDHVLFDMVDGTRVTFADPRRFGMMVFADRLAPDSHKLLASLGPDPLSNSFSGGYLSEALKGKKTPIKAALLDQRIVSGLGNIYVCEALFRAGISPKRSAATVAGKRAERLVPHITTVLRDAIAAGGSSLKDYRNADGDLGYFQHAFDVYDREGQACRKEGCGGNVKRVVQSGRSSFYCPTCQR